MYILAGRWLGNRVDILASFFITAVSFISVGLVDCKLNNLLPCK